MMFLLQAFSINIRFERLCACLFCALTLISFPAALAAQSQPDPAAKLIKLSKVEFSGLQSRTEEEVLAASGLQVGQAIDIPTLDAAAERLMGSGYFKQLRYRYRTTGDQAVVTFQVEEAAGKTSPVVFDNFVWFSEEELTNAVRRQVPSFNGTAPDGAIDSITKVLQSLLQAGKFPGRVEYTPSANLSGGGAEHIFSVEGVKMPICAVQFSNARGITESDLAGKSQPLIAEDYRRSFVASFAQANLIPLYRERGFLRAEFRAPTAKLGTAVAETEGSCANGVTVILPVEEGMIYVWDKAAWGGNTALSVAELEAALGMKSGERANGLKIDKGLDSARIAYTRKGYLKAEITPTPVFDDNTRRVSYRIEIREGEQYRMGTLTITGLTEDTANKLREKWKLQPGDVYDAEYPKEFIKQEVIPALGAASANKKISSNLKTDREKFTVDVTLAFQ